MENQEKGRCSCGAETDAKWKKKCGECFKKEKQQDKPNGEKKGKDLSDYVQVHERISQFWRDHPNGRIHTEILKWENDIIVMKAEGYRDINDQLPFAVGHAYEEVGSSLVNTTSALENCETSCIGRMLGIGSYEIKKSIASREEVAQAIEKQNTLPEAPEMEPEIKEIAGELDQDLENDKKEDSRVLWRTLNGQNGEKGFEEQYSKWKRAGYSSHQIYQHLYKVFQERQAG